jgi:hypothetical protein
MARKASIPGFAGGGLISGGVSGDADPSAVTALLSRYSGTAVSDKTGVQAVSQYGAALAAALKGISAAAAKANSAGIGMAGISNSSAESALQSAAAAHGWTGAQWTALFDVEMKEAGFNLSATNPSSGAYGMAQFIEGASEYAQYGGNATSAAGQAVAMSNYVAQRYGTPEAALAHEDEFGWYSGGGSVQPATAGRMLNEPVFGVGLSSGRNYSFSEHAPEYVGPLSGNGTGSQAMPGATQYGQQATNQLLQQQNKMMAQLPYTIAQAVNGAVGAGVRRGAFAVGG